ncbi:hypothetical protein CAPTEDRAFT_130757 [Capitella teleta]|uniref:Fibronectin type-III domain-containing protein n=1 Tax=Capitella teleta TaxID=283909 RepID=R7TP33_CAPTE|nr:hypothetical protein CAPTEDRAFT_130757 [Capitella teleta]|eukprot:ELT93286.1 hypothetical protein CAPTEDRAFT_130757 [Capitella teleta]
MDEEEEYVQGVIETVDTAKKYRIQLSELLDELEAAESQIATSANMSRNQLRNHFERVKCCIEASLDSRRKELEEQIADEERRAAAPLTECRTIIQQNVQLAQQVLNEGKTLLINDHQSQKSAMVEFKKKVNELSLDSLPEVPVLADIAFISVDLPRDEDTAETQLADAIKEYGRVISHAPVQITLAEERPGAILVQWMERDDDCGLDLAEFRLQFCQGNSKRAEVNEDAFKTVYEGPQHSTVVRHLAPSVHYMFRVCGRPDGSNQWSVWSVPCSASTSIAPYEWSAEQEGYSVSGDVAERISKAPPPSTLFSQSACYTCGTSIVFRIMECGQTSDDDGIALCQMNDTNHNMMAAGSLFVCTNGAIFQDGFEKTTRLPALTRGSVLTFDTEVLASGKVRVTIEISEKIVTFDWSVASAAVDSMGCFGVMGPAQEKSIQLYFALKLNHPDWRVRVE